MVLWLIRALIGSCVHTRLKYSKDCENIFANWWGFYKFTMMQTFRSVFPDRSYPAKISHQTPILSLGSCFAVEMGQRLKDLKFDLQINPFGLQYNPASLAEGMVHLMGEKVFEKADLFENQGLWRSFAHHSQFAHPDPDQALVLINEALSAARLHLEKANFLFLTLGTAQVWRLAENDSVVNNCHKLPAKQFKKSYLDVFTCVDTLSAGLDAIFASHPKLQVLISVSPVRYLREGIVENNRSKAILLLATAQLEEKYQQVHYFPAYELLMDDLRDYRFYANDLAHPNGLALDYIWTYLQNNLMDEATRKTCEAIAQLNKGMHHRPLHGDSTAWQQFRQAQLKKMEELEKKYPFLDFGVERVFFENNT
jgi:hypothetical protein